ncbi:homoserine O-succinyltransferase [Basilea psittacipulmonis]|uniref:Homoserine O-acetyltransferase n=1 Tax=Basilea psittacipulmonis DSM 24701 TaxID=1072685 RepID=A0A077DD22_9BURK|nr:homoserine O-succinyltransferase [Basilea psittacipulmonis]AIL32076.1 homoserine O-succinyltransferase [Basilea psittacipulmonis DSM 24701]
MPVIIPKDIPAYAYLKDRSFVMDTERANTQDIRPLEILIVNLMPTKIDTENQILSLLSNSPLQTNITLLSTQTYIGQNTPIEHLNQFYIGIEEAKKRRFDGAIVTGAPVETLAYTDVHYWHELQGIFNFLKEHVTSTLYLCWGAMAGLYHFHGIDKVALDEKKFGIFDHEKQADDLLLTNLNDFVAIPHSRHSALNETQVKNASGVEVLLYSEEAGSTVLRNDQDIFIMGHPEYTRETLHKEFIRDKDLGKAIKPPVNYYRTRIGDLNDINYKWRSDSNTLFSNWINYRIYQTTPFVL